LRGRRSGHGRHAWRDRRPASALADRTGRASPYQIYASDETGDLILTFFNARRDYLEKLLPVGELRYVSGTTGTYDGMLQMVHPGPRGRREPVSPSCRCRAGLSADRGLEPQPGAQGVSMPRCRSCRTCRNGRNRPGCARERYPRSRRAEDILHRPQPADVSPDSRAWMRLAYDELLAGNSRLRWCARICDGRPGAPRPAPARCAKARRRLPYSLTASQSRAIADIAADLAKPGTHAAAAAGRRRIGQDVVALLSAATVIEADGRRR
jgi:ATP-dependent DNA helicase RecG